MKINYININQAKYTLSLQLLVQNLKYILYNQSL